MGVKRNFVYSSILTLSNYLFPLITYPYVSRVLGVTNIGICGFVDSIIQYFILLSTLGVMTVGIREIAADRNDSNALRKTFNSIFVINGIATLLVVCILLLLIHAVPQLYIHKSLLYIGVAKIVGNFLLIEWLFRGLEDFKYITYRALIVKVLYVISVFIFVRSSNDIANYYFLLSITVLLNAVINLKYSHRFVRFSFKSLALGKYVKPIIVLGLYGVITSMYTTFNVTYLGFVASNDEVGYYSTAIKLHTLILAFYTAFTGVMLPKMSALLAENKIDEFKDKITKSFDVLIALAIPLLLFCVVFAVDIVDAVAGPGYEGAYKPTMIVMPLILIIGCNQIFIIQILTPLKQDKAILRNSMVGASIGIVLNILLVKDLGAIGSSIVWLISESSIFIISCYSVYKTLHHIFPYHSVMKNIFSYIPMFGIAILLCIYISPSFCRLVVAFLSIQIYAILNQKLYLRNETLLQICNSLTNKQKNE